MTFTNLFIGYNKEEDFRILICAWGEEEAQQLANEYCAEAKLNGRFDIFEIEEKLDEIHFDCDYVIAREK